MVDVFCMRYDISLAINNVLLQNCVLKIKEEQIIWTKIKM